MVWFVSSDTVHSAIRQLEHNSDRGIAIIAAAILEEHITNQIKRRWCDAPATVRRMLHVDGPLGNFGPKIDLVFLMGLVSPEAHQDMVLIKKVRNKFAHYLDVDNFESPVIRGWCFDLKHFENFVFKDEEMKIGAPAIPKKIFGVAGITEQLKTAKGRYMVAIQVYSILFGPDWPNTYLPRTAIPSPIY